MRCWGIDLIGIAFEILSWQVPSEIYNKPNFQNRRSLAHSLARLKFMLSIPLKLIYLFVIRNSLCRIYLVRKRNKDLKVSSDRKQLRAQTGGWMHLVERKYVRSVKSGAPNWRTLTAWMKEVKWRVRKAARASMLDGKQRAEQTNPSVFSKWNCYVQSSIEYSFAT